MSNNEDVRMAPVGAGPISAEQFVSLVQHISAAQQQEPRNKRARENNDGRHSKALMEHKIWRLLSHECKQHTHALKRAYASAGMRIPLTFLVPSSAKDDPDEVVQRSMEHLPPGMHGRVDPSLLALKSAYIEAIQYAQQVRLVRSDEIPPVARLLAELHALDSRGELPASAKALLPRASSAFDNIDAVMDAETSIPKIRFPRIDPTEEPVMGPQGGEHA